MADLVQPAQDALLALNRSGVTYALCGGLAMAVHGQPRSTWDIDVVVDDDDALGAALTALTAVGWAVNRQSIDFPDGFRLHRMIKRFGQSLFVLDLLRSPPGQACAADRERTELAGAACWAVSRQTLLRMKRSAGREQDLLDIKFLEATDG